MAVAGRPGRLLGLCCCLVLGKHSLGSCTGLGIQGTQPVGGASGVVQACFWLQPLPQPL